MLSKGHKKTGVCTKVDSHVSFETVIPLIDNFTMNCIFHHFIEEN